MISNFTLTGLIVSSLSNSPYMIMSSSSHNHPKLQVTNSIFRNHFSNFLHINSNLFSASIKKSQFTGFLSSCIEIERAGRIEADSSFEVRATSFLNNTTPFNGGCIKVSTDSTVDVNISNCEFSYNQAGVGGALYILSLGSLNMDENMFRYNHADTASHAFISIPSFFSVNDTYEFSRGTDSSILFISNRDVTYVISFNDCDFYQNNATMDFANLEQSDITFTSCNFMKYSDQNLTQYQNQYFFDNTSTKSAEFTRCQFNQYYVEGPATITVGEIVSYLEGSAMTTDAEAIRLIPTQSATVEANWRSTPAIFSVCCMVFFFIVSIIGIIIVSCSNKNYGKQQQVLDISETKED
ncbi:hypothetical protein GPJ56_009926 [Histomonas meleagridis]|uniref:uncharacterized protein n=1 Tax=Histomonas meleagridis TaxID=135588 RepID=UPI003559A02E|nr:hypothetical protein GPJ56_009926 [Histomonas meleagridis]KAH0802766.1 hypothetical protein GO595_004273 [Histomonas meleagridis]